MSRLVYGWIGDSITEGYGDGVTISCMGVPGRMLRAAIDKATAVTAVHVNMGASGRMVPQYIDIAKGIIEADPTRFTAVLVSIWSPNIPADVEPGEWPTQPANMELMLSALIAFEQWLLERSIVFMPTFMAGSPFNMNDVRCARLQTFLDACTQRWPWLLNLNTPVQNPEVTSGPYMLTGVYCSDATHPNSAGYDAMFGWVSTRLDAAFNQACAAYGFVEE